MMRLEKVNSELGRECSEQGTALLGVLILTALATIVLSTTLTISASSARTTKSIKSATVDFYESEESLNLALGWLRDNSTEFIEMFKKENYYSEFDTTPTAIGSNDITSFAVPSRIRVDGSSSAPLLVSSSVLGTANFPSGVTLDLQNSFQSASLGNAEVRVTLLNGIPENSAQDYGDPDLGNADPETNFYPIFRIDAMDSLTGGSHLHMLVVGSLVSTASLGFYGEDNLEMRQGCDSYSSENGSYGPSNKAANCGVGSNVNVQIHQAETIYGSIQSNGGIDSTNPWGGAACADFVSGCPNAGTSCSGGCSVPLLPSYNSWSTYCSSDQGNVTISSNTTLTVASNSPSDKCWNEVTVNNNKTLTLTTTTTPYYFKTFDIANNGTVDFQPSPNSDTIEIYVESFAGDRFNGNQVFNTNNKPYQLIIHYLGTDTLTLNGNADMKAKLIAPNATVEVSGNFDYYGSILAKSLTATGSGALHYDESGSTSTVTDVNFTPKSVTQRYR